MIVAALWSCFLINKVILIVFVASLLLWPVILIIISFIVCYSSCVTHRIFAGGLHDLTEADADSLPLVALV